MLVILIKIKWKTKLISRFASFTNIEIKLPDDSDKKIAYTLLQTITDGNR